MRGLGSSNSQNQRPMPFMHNIAKVRLQGVKTLSSSFEKMLHSSFDRKSLLCDPASHARDFLGQKFSVAHLERAVCTVKQGVANLTPS